MVDFDGDAPPPHLQFRDQSGEAGIAIDSVGLAIQLDLKTCGGNFGHDEGRFLRPAEKWPLAEPDRSAKFRALQPGLPYAGIIRIRFEGFSCEFSVLTHTPSQDSYITGHEILSKMEPTRLISGGGGGLG
jgi:hypothetical protein